MEEPQESQEEESLSSDESLGQDKSEPIIFSLEAEAEAPTAPVSVAPEQGIKPEPKLFTPEPLLVNFEPQAVPEVEKTSGQSQLDTTKSQKMNEVSHNFTLAVHLNS